MANRAMNRNNSSIFGLFLITLNDIYTLSSVSLIPLLRDPSDLSHELAIANLTTLRWVGGSPRNTSGSSRGTQLALMHRS